jgi:hypothetical protein
LVGRTLGAETTIGRHGHYFAAPRSPLNAEFLQFILASSGSFATVAIPVKNAVAFGASPLAPRRRPALGSVAGT